LSLACALRLLCFYCLCNIVSLSSMEPQLLSPLRFSFESLLFCFLYIGQLGPVPLHFIWFFSYGLSASDHSDRSLGSVNLDFILLWSSRLSASALCSLFDLSDLVTRTAFQAWYYFVVSSSINPKERMISFYSKCFFLSLITCRGLLCSVSLLHWKWPNLKPL